MAQIILAVPPNMRHRRLFSNFLELNLFLDIGDHESDSNDSDYVPFKITSPKVKRGRGRPRKHAPKPPKGSRPRGRPPARLKVEPKKEDEDEDDAEGEFPCIDCKKVFHQFGALKKHRCKNDEPKVCVCEIALHCAPIVLIIVL